MRLRLAVTIAALLFFSAPIALRAVGVTARPFENRRLADFPRLTQGFDAFPQAGRFFVDRLPLREQAVRLNTWVSRSIFATTPNYARSASESSRTTLPFGAPAAKPGVAGGVADDDAGPGALPPAGQRALEGRHGWLFLDGELMRACQRFIPYPKAMARWVAMIEVIRRSGRRAVLVIPADKSTIYPEFIGDKNPSADCMVQKRAAAWRAMESTDNRFVVPLRRPLLEHKAASSELLYRRKDTHWNGAGAAVAVRETLRALGTDVQVRDGEMKPSKEVYQGDLTGLLGAPEKDTTPGRTIMRADGAPLIPGRTLFIYDSFGVGMLGLLGPYFERLSTYLWFGSTRRGMLERIAAADMVILESAERDMTFKASDQGFVTPRFLAALRKRLGTRAR
jgi:alginate O-acetyltransferase complex protein AlgJ